MPNDMTQLSARDMAQMRGLATRKGLPLWATDVFANAGLTLKAAETLADPMKKILELSEMAGTTADQIKELCETLLADMGEEPTPKEGEGLVKAALAKILEMRAAADDAVSGARHQGHRPAEPRNDRQQVRLSDRLGDAMAAQIAQRLGLSFEPTMGREFVNMSRADMARMVARDSRVVVGDDTDAMRHWMTGTHTTSDYYHSTTAGLNAVLARGIEMQPPAILRATHEMSATDFREHRSVALSASGKLAKNVEGANIKHVTIDETGYAAPTLSNHAAIYRLTREAIVNSATSINLETQVAKKMLEGAISTLRDVILEPMLANSGAGETLLDAKAVFHADRGNLAGTGSALSVASVSAARAAMMRQTDSQGTLLAIVPTLLVVAADQLTVAEQLVAELAAATVEEVNPFSRKLEIVCEAGLPSGGWYVAADPGRADGLAVSFLDGNRMPTIETRDPWDSLGIEYRVVWAVAAAFVQPLTWYRNPGV